MRQVKWLVVGLVVGLAGSIGHAAPKQTKRPPTKRTVTQKPKAAPKPKDNQAAYAAKVTKINRVLTVQLAEASGDASHYASLKSILDNRAAMGMPIDDEEFGRETEGAAYVKPSVTLAQVKSKLQKNIPLIKIQLRDLRSVSPVPVSMKSIDDNYTKFSKDAESALDLIAYGLAQNDAVIVSVAQKQLSKSYDYFTPASDELRRLTDPAVKAKVYTKD